MTNAVQNFANLAKTFVPLRLKIRNQTYNSLLTTPEFLVLGNLPNGCIVGLPSCFLLRKRLILRCICSLRVHSNQNSYLKSLFLEQKKVLEILILVSLLNLFFHLQKTHLRQHTIFH